MKRNFLTKAERALLILSSQSKEILVGLFLGDLYARKRSLTGNARLEFAQGVIHKDYLLHLYDLFKMYCSAEPKVNNHSPHKLTGKSYTSVKFETRSLPCFNELFELFYTTGGKIVPANIAELLTPLALCYWICDDGTFDKSRQAVKIHTEGFTFEEVKLLTKVLNNKFGLKCTINSKKGHSIIRISTKSLKDLQTLLEPVMPSMMRHKIGL